VALKTRKTRGLFTGVIELYMVFTLRLWQLRGCMIMLNNKWAGSIFGLTIKKG